MDRQLLLRTLEGRTVVVWWPLHWSAGEFVESVQAQAEHVRGERDFDVRLTDGRRVSDTCIPDTGSTLHVTLPLKGGKGGFGKAIRDLGRGYGVCIYQQCLGSMINARGGTALPV